MTKSNGDRFAFNTLGLTKRELLAALAMQGQLSKGATFPGVVAEQAVRFADALIEELAGRRQSSGTDDASTGDPARVLDTILWVRDEGVEADGSNPGSNKFERFVFSLFLVYGGYQGAEDASKSAIADAKILLEALRQSDRYDLPTP